jgi:hypothetical protein
MASDYRTIGARRESRGRPAGEDGKIDASRP